jgi:hypothetical protein
MGFGHAHPKMTSGCCSRHLRVYDVISRERRVKMACTMTFVRAKFPGNKSFRLFRHVFILFVEHYLWHIYLILFLTPCHWWFTHSQHTIQTTNTAKWRLIVYHIHHVHNLLPSGMSGNITRNVIDVASRSDDKSRHATNTLSMSRRGVVWNIDRPWRHERHWVWPRT